MKEMTLKAAFERTVHPNNKQRQIAYNSIIRSFIPEFSKDIQTKNNEGSVQDCMLLITKNLQDIVDIEVRDNSKKEHVIGQITNEGGMLTVDYQYRDMDMKIDVSPRFASLTFIPGQSLSLQSTGYSMFLIKDSEGSWNFKEQFTTEDMIDETKVPYTDPNDNVIDDDGIDEVLGQKTPTSRWVKRQQCGIRGGY